MVAAIAAAVGCTVPDPNYNPPDSQPKNDAPDVSPDAAANVDASDAAADIPATLAVFPPNGYTTGSVHVPIVVANHPLKPKFVWTAVAEADDYQIQLTSECEIGSFRTCAFASPTIDTTTTETTYRPDSVLDVATTAPVGLRYFWRVRACRNGVGCSAWTEVRYLDVGRRADDFNGDGYADVIVSASGETRDGVNEAGRVYLYYGGTGGINEAADVTLESGQPEEKGRFGTSVASAGDVNGDGYADLVVGAFGEDADGFASAGRAYLYYGRASGISTTADVSLESGRPAAGGRFGISVASTGDLNGDGFADVIVGAFQETEDGQANAGRAYVYYGGGDGISEAADVTLKSGDPEAGGSFGVSVAGAGDVNGDGYVDVVLGAHRETVNAIANAGRAYVYYGGVSGISGSADATLESGQPEPGGRFGVSVASAGDVNGDGYADLVIGAIGETIGQLSGAGRAYIYHGGDTGIAGVADGSIESGRLEADGSFGQAVASAGDVNGDGYSDLIVGAYTETVDTQNNAGRAYVYYGDAAGTPAGADVTLQSAQPEEFGLFGVSVASAGDVDGDGYTDVVVGASSETVGGQGAAGRAHVYHGSTAGIDIAVDVTLNSSQPEGFGGFGSSVASALDATQPNPAIADRA